MSEVKSYRKPYTPKVEWNWWTKVPYLTRYMVREGTCVLALFVACELILGVFLFAMCNLVDNPTEADVAPYLWWVNSFVGNPIVMLLNLVSLGAVLYHAVTFFALMPKSMRVFMNKNTTDLVPDYFMLGACYGALGGATLVILIVAFATM
ncbi:MAG: fumarate reductase subunit C [Candidatus Anaerobiospirillum merdipullorum]|uniref:Fumarate reductase subunit C n=1 Tax=Candidatus Anaerobiospirillum merdipullorum TaxID=2838450 RepID=A0A9E2KLS0_9GAMM|nr:fumarate reductase subunit C [Candidatus Anaerobiospirillum merdipullorum]